MSISTNPFESSMIEHIRRFIAQKNELGASGRAICEKFELYLFGERDGVTLDHVFGLSCIINREQSDEALRRLALLLVPYGPVREAARQVSAALIRYEATSWLRDRDLEEMPSSYLGTFKELLFIAFRLRGRDVPRGESRLREIIGPAFSKDQRRLAGQMAFNRPFQR